LTRSGAESVSSADIAAFQRNGFAVVRRLFDARGVERISGWLDELERAPERPGSQWMYFEPSQSEPGVRLLNRIENFAPYHPQLADLLAGDLLVGAVSSLLGERAVLFKDKVEPPSLRRRRLRGAPGRAGELERVCEPVHHVCTRRRSHHAENGCLSWRTSTARADRRALVPAQRREPRRRRVRSVPDGAGDVAPSSTPTCLIARHRTPPARRRRVLYVTYNRASEGDHRARYYADKHANYPPDCERRPGKQYAYRV
jgi:hypothetical protein